jgi:N-acetyl-gamma-glutamyl-phosphate reductase
MYTVFIDGAQGTTGLRLRERLASRPELKLLELPEELRKNRDARREAMRRAEISFLCLPDDAARDSAELAQGTGTRIIDASTAHRTQSGWVYGFPELARGRREEIAAADRVAVPGCHASGFAAVVFPLRQAGVLGEGALLSCFSVTGYSGGGKGMIAEYEDAARPAELDAPRQYGLGQKHKHLPEMCAVCGLEAPPIFAPVVADFPCGMAVSVPLHAALLQKPLGLDGALALYQEHYKGERAIRVLSADVAAEDGFLSANPLSGRDDMEIIICGNDERLIITARFDNLGKGASGAAVQCMNLMLGLPEYAGLNIK